MAEAVADSDDAAGTKVNKTSGAQKHPILGKVEPIHQQISDVGQYSYAALCATALRTLFSAEEHRKFVEESLALILISLEQPQQVCESVRAMLHGHGLDEMDPYIDVLLAEPALKEGAEPLLSQLLAISIGQGTYDARMRVLIKHIAWRLRVTWETLEDLESELSDSLAFTQYEMSDEELEEKQMKEKKRKLKRYALIGLATVGGGTLIGLTGGLAAPLVAAGAGALIGGAGAAVLGSATGVALIGSLFGVAGAGLTGYKMKRRIGAIEEFEFEPLVCGNSLKVQSLSSQLHITIAVTGWLSNSMRDFRQPWRHLAESKEQYTLKWETKYLVQLGEALDYIFNSALAMATQEALKYTVLQGILAAVAWPATLISASNIIDNPWSVALQRAHSAGRMLAEVLLGRQQGRRPVTLIGYSLGARVVFSCLEEMSKRKGCEGIVEDVILLGTPASGDPQVWASFKKVISGKIVNGFCRGDWLLKFLYRTSSVQMSIAGLRPVQWDDRRMHNIDLSDVVNGHLDYRNSLDVIMKAVGIKTKDEVGLPSSGSSASSKSSSKAASPVSEEIGIDDISSSDSEMYEEWKKPIKVKTKQTDPVQEPVVLEDYTTSDKQHPKSEFPEAFPESTSFDSGVEINRATSELKEQLGKEELSWSDDVADVSKAAAALKEKTVALDSVSSASDFGDIERLNSNPADDRIIEGAVAVKSSDSEEDLDAGRLSPSVNLDEEPSTPAVNNLERKKMYDSMYRLVIDDDLEEMLGEEEEEEGVIS